MIVVDASALLEAQLGRGRRGERVARRLEDESDHSAPQIIKAEALSALRSLVAVGDQPSERAAVVARRVQEFEIETHPIEHFIPRVWALRHNLSVYDAWYVALAENLGATLVTTDGRLARTPGIRCEVDLIS